MTFTSRKPKSWRLYPALYQCMYICRAAWIEEHMALADARLGLQQTRFEQRLDDRLGELAVVAGKAAREVHDLRVVAAPLAHAVEPLEDAPGNSARRIGIVVGPRGLLAGGVEEQLLELGDGCGIGRHTAQRGDPGRGAHGVAVADRLAQVACRQLADQ